MKTDINELQSSLLKWINGSVELQSLLYDLDLMPEQLKRGTKDWSRMMMLAAWHRSKAEWTQTKTK